MALPGWPTIVPYASQTDDLAISQFAEPPLATEMNAGTIRQRRKYTLRISEVTVALVMSRPQFQAFRTFHAGLGDGAARFTMPVWNGTEYVTRTVQIKDQPNMSVHAYHRRLVHMTLRVESL